jgi:hypothetical protein
LIFSSNATLWKEIARIHTSSYGTVFDGSIFPNDLSLLFSKLSFFVSAIECREIALIMSPGGNGIISESDVEGFMTSTCRPLGELLSLLDTEILKSLTTAYRALRKAMQLGDPTSVARRNFEEILANMVTAVQTTVVISDNPSYVKSNEIRHEIVAVQQVSNGIANFCRYE